MSEYNDLTSLLSNRLSNVGNAPNATEEQMNARYEEVNNLQTQKDIFDAAIAQGFKLTKTATFADAENYLKQLGTYDQVVSQAGMLNKATARGYTGTNIAEAIQFNDSYNTAATQAQAAGMQVTPTTTFQDVEQFSNQNQQAFNATAGTGITDGVNASTVIGTQPTTATTTPGTNTTTQTNQAAQMTDAEFKQWLSTQNLSADQKAALTAVYDSISLNDVARAQQVTQAMAAATQYSDPYFKAQIALVTDALSRGLQAQEGDLAFNMQQLQSSLQKLQDDIAASKDMLSFEHQQELQDLARKYQGDMEATAQNMAATGFTTSTRRTRTEGMLTDINEGMVESSNRQFGYQTGNLNRQLSFADQNTQAQIANLQRLAQEGKIDALRQAEQQVGSQTLSGLGYTGLLGNQGGEIPRAQVQDALAFAGQSGFVF